MKVHTFFKTTVISVVIVSLTFFGFTPPQVSLAQTTSPPVPPSGKSALYLSPTSHSVALNTVFPVDIILNTNGKDINSVTAALSFNASLLQVDSISYSQSAFPSSVEERVEGGTITITRFKIPDSSGNAVMSTAAHVARVNFRAVASGTATVTILWNGAGLGPSYAIDNKQAGVDTLGVVKGGTYTLGSGGSTTPPPPPPPTDPTPPPPPPPSSSPPATNPPTPPSGKAALYTSPTSQGVALNNTFPVDIVLNTNGRNVNSVTAQISFDSSRLQLVGIDNSSSVFPSSAEETVSGNTIKVTRFKTPPAINSSNAIVTRLNFRAINTGTASVNIQWGGTTGQGPSIVFDHDLQQDILGAVRGGTFSVGTTTAPPPPPPPTGPTLPPPPPPPPPTGPLTITQGPTVDSQSLSRVIIVWNTSNLASSEVEYGHDSSYGLRVVNFSRTTSHRITLTGLDPGATYHFRVRSKDAAGQEVVSGNRTFAAPDIQAQKGVWVGTFFDKKDLKEFRMGAGTRYINFNWGASAPSTNIDPAEFSVRWKGIFNFPQGSYTFNAEGDDGFRMYIDGNSVIDAWNNSGFTSRTATQNLSGEHLLVVEYFKASGEARMKLEFNLPGQSGGAAFLPPPPPPPPLTSDTFKPGDRITLRQYSAVFGEPDIFSQHLGTQFPGDAATVQSLGEFDGRRWWWQVQYDGGLSGWSRGATFLREGEEFAPPPTLTEPVIPSRNDFTVGQRVVTTVRLNTRASVGIDGAYLGTHNVGTFGTITGGPELVGGTWWWNVDYDIDPDGWSADFGLAAADGTAPPPPPPTTEPPPPPPTQPPPPPPPSTSPDHNNFTVGQRVVTTVRLNVRASAGIDGAYLGTHNIGTFGTITGGPELVGGTWWWNVDYDVAPDGWSVDSGLAAADGTTPPPPPPPTQPPPPPPPPPAQLIHPSLRLQPGAATVSTGQQFTVDVVVNTGGQDTISVASHLTFDSSRLQLVSADTSNSVYTLEASREETANGIKLDLGAFAAVNTSSGLVTRLTFQATSSGTANITFDLTSPGSGPSRIVRFGDTGDDILASVGNATITIQ